MEITSAAFGYSELIPAIYTCMGDNINPPLQFKDVPDITQSLVLIVEDVDAQPKSWTHWLLFNIPAHTRYIEQHSIPPGATEGLANNNSFGYEGPCPKYFTGTHHYWFRLYALDIQLRLPAASEKKQVEEHMKKNILQQAGLLGLCRSGK